MKIKLTLLVLLVNLETIAQGNTYIGRILDSETHKPIPGVNIVIPEKVSTYTNILGYFELSKKVAWDKIMKISHVGYQAVEVRVPMEDRFQISLRRDTVLLPPLFLNFYPSSAMPDSCIVETIQDKDTINLTSLEYPATFPGGLDNFFTWLGNGLRNNLAGGIELGFTIKFTINEKGEPTDLILLDTIENMETGVIAAFNNMPRWKPAMQREKPVKQSFEIYIKQTINDQRFYELYRFLWARYHHISNPLTSTSVCIELSLDDSGNLANIQTLNDESDFGKALASLFREIPLAITSDMRYKTNKTKFILPVNFSYGKVHHKSFCRASDEDAYVLSTFDIRTGPMPARKINQVIHLPIFGQQTYRAYSNLTNFGESPKMVNQLSVSNCYLRSFPQIITTLPNLEFLEMESNALQFLPEKIDTLSKLQELYLFENQISQLPPTFKHLKKLKVLGLGSNQLRDFPLEITKLTKLEVLDLSDNQLTSIPENIGAMKKLRVLILHNNKIVTLPKAFFDLTNLERIYLQGNPLNTEDKYKLKLIYKRAYVEY